MRCRGSRPRRCLASKAGPAIRDGASPRPGPPVEAEWSAAGFRPGATAPDEAARPGWHGTAPAVRMPGGRQGRDATRPPGFGPGSCRTDRRPSRAVATPPARALPCEDRARAAVPASAATPRRSRQEDSTPSQPPPRSPAVPARAAPAGSPARPHPPAPAASEAAPAPAETAFARASCSSSCRHPSASHFGADNPSELNSGLTSPGGARYRESSDDPHRGAPGRTTA